MADCSTHNDDVALLMIRRKPGKAASGSLDSSGPADAGTAHERDIRWSGQHAIVTMPAEMDLVNSSDVSDLWQPRPGPQRPAVPVLRLRGWGLGASHWCWEGFPQDALFGCGVEEIEHEWLSASGA